MSDTRDHLAILTSHAEKHVSPTLFGLFLEDINFAGDGGLNANLVNNYSFDGVYLINGVLPYAPLDLVPAEHRERLANTPPELLTLPLNTPAGRINDQTRHWTIEDGHLEGSHDRPIAEGAGFGRISSRGIARLANLGYPGERPGMFFDTERPLTFSAYVRCDDFAGEIGVQLLGADGQTVASGVLPDPGTGWQKAELTLSPSATGLGSLRIAFHGSGMIDLDEVRLIPEDHWGAGDPRWSQGLLRRDIVEVLQALQPRFLRFPGGCLVEGCGDGSHYKWKETVGELVSRKQEYNLWGQQRADGDYSQSNQIGFYEYFLLCEDLRMVPIPVLWAGVSCQARMDVHLDMDSPEFAEVIQDAVDMIDWATGDPHTNRWAALRAEAGHPEPFALSHMGIGNENFGAEYLGHFARIKEAVDAHHPGLNLIVNGGVFPAGESIDPAWATWGDDAQILVDEHFYNPPSWFFESSERYSAYPRGGARVFLGEYAAHTPNDFADSHPAIPDDLAMQEPNTWLSAIAEAAFLTGVEQNSDVVAFSCYAPMLNLVENGQWAHNLIDISPAHVVPTANYLVQQLFGTHIGETIVPTEGALPSGVYRSATQGAGHIHIKLVNINSAPVEISLRIEGARDGDITATTIAGPLGAVNRLTFDGLPSMEVETTSSTHTIRAEDLTLEMAPTSVTALSVPML